MVSAKRISHADNLIEMNQTLSDNLLRDTGDESSVPQSPSRSSKPKSSGSSKAGDTKTKEDKSSTETPKENKRRKDNKERKKAKEEKKEKESKKSSDSTETPQEKAKRRKERKDKKEKKENTSKRSKSRKSDGTAEQQQKLNTSEELQCRSLGFEDVTQASTDTDSLWSGDYAFTLETLSPNEKENLLRMIKTLRRRVDEVESENRHLNEKNTAMHDLETHLNQAEEQLEYATEENYEFSTRVYVLEQALVAQETELDNALATIRKQAKRE
jgi:hypothetical protein